MNWDEQVDVVCIGTGAGALASAISVVDLGGEVFVAGSPDDNAPSETHIRPRTDRLDRWLGVDISDSETYEYLAALSDLGPLRRTTWDGDVPIRVVHEPVPIESGRTVAPFVGSRLRDWAARCLASPYGFLYTRVSNWQSTTLHTADGEMIEVAEIGSMTPDPQDVGGSVLDWLTAEAHDRPIEVHPNSTLQRMVFEEGDVVGAVFTTPDGTLAVRARHGVTVATGGGQVHPVTRHQLSAGQTALRVCMVGQYASRFARVELLSSESLATYVPSACRPVNPQLHVKMHETHGRSQTWRCGKVHGNPPFSQ